MTTNTDIGIVTRREGPQFWAHLNGDEIPCVLRGRLKKKQQRVNSLVVVGDRVEVSRSPDGTGVIEELLPRRSDLVRPTTYRGLPHVMAANVDRLIIVQAARQPAFKRHLVERFMALARRGGVEPVVVVNKCDLEDEAVVQSWVEPLAASQVPVLRVSAATGQGLDELRPWLEGQISVLAGQSGVGKSSLLQALYPSLSIRTGAVSYRTQKGRHTTTQSRLYPLPGGGYLADTPGIRELALFEDAAEALTEVFPEIEAAGAGCKFRNCSHTHEPGCAVKAAVAEGAIDPDRYQHYLRLQRGG